MAGVGGPFRRLCSTEVRASLRPVRWPRARQFGQSHWLVVVLAHMLWRRAQRGQGERQQSGEPVAERRADLESGKQPLHANGLMVWRNTADTPNSGQRRWRGQRI